MVWQYLIYFHIALGWGTNGSGRSKSNEHRLLFQEVSWYGEGDQQVGALFPSLQCHHSLAQTKAPNNVEPKCCLISKVLHNMPHMTCPALPRPGAPPATLSPPATILLCLYTCYVCTRMTISPWIPFSSFTSDHTNISPHASPVI